MAGCDIKPGRVMTAEQCAQANICDITTDSIICHNITGHTVDIPSITLTVPTDCTLKEVVGVSINGTDRNLDDPSPYGYTVAGMDVLFNTPISATPANACYGKVTYVVTCSICNQTLCA